jgi:hypothetical protein
MAAMMVSLTKEAKSFVIVFTDMVTMTSHAKEEY